MKKYILLWCTMFIFLLCGCATKPQQTQPPVSTATETAPTENIPATTEPRTQMPAESEIWITEPPADLLDIAAGAYLETYTDKNTGDYLDYYLFMPENAEKGMPLIVFLHGDGEIGRPELLENYGMMQSAREIYGDNFPFIAISPCTRTTSWINGNIPHTLKGLIDETAQRFAVDSDRIIITGHSRGSMGVWYMISEYGDYFSAAVPVSCGPDSVLDIENCVKVSVRAAAGNSGADENRYRAAMENTVATLHEHGCDIGMILLEHMTHGETCTAAYNEEMFTWMISQ